MRSNQNKSKELVLELKGKEPQQLTLKRVAEYMNEFASFIGSNSETLFSEIRVGSTCIAAQAAAGGTTKLQKRAIDASRGLGPLDAQKAFMKISEMASQDRLPARFWANRSVILHFPKPPKKFEPLKIWERGHITGVVSGLVGDGKSGVKVRVRPLDGGPLVYCKTNERFGRELGKNFLSCVRVFGPGCWARGVDGTWVCEEIEVEEVIVVEQTQLEDAFASLQELDVTWTDDPFDFDPGLEAV